MTALGVRGSRFHNAVSRVHARVSSNMLQNLWPQIPADENAIEYVTNAVHAPTFLAPEWSIVFDEILGADWIERLDSDELRKLLEHFPDEKVWEIHQQLKSQMLSLLRRHVTAQHFRNRGSDTRLERRVAYANAERPNVLTIGFARRFATYKRAELLLNDLERLRRIVSQPERPVVFVFAGKAHPADAPGQQLIREVARVGHLPEFEDKLLLAEGYDLHLARRLVFGVDVWLNTPIYGFEASGTSGMKAGMNGVLNLSVLDGWWDEAYERGIGWAIKPAAQGLDQEARDREDATALYDLLENQVIPLYYNRPNGHYPREWIAMAKQSIAVMLPRFNARRMLNEYVHRFYSRAAHRGRQFTANGHAQAVKFSEWKAHLHAVWPHVTISVVEPMPSPLSFGESNRVSALVQLAGLKPEDVVVELIIDRPATAEPPQREAPLVLGPEGAVQSDGGQRYTLEFTPDFCGRANYSIRVYPYHELLAHRFELGLMIWA
jgi:starch phosphorylase